MDEIDPVSFGKVLRHYQTAADMKTGWQNNLKVTFVDAVFFRRGEAIESKLVDDLTTLPEVVELRCQREGFSHAVYPYMGRWALYSTLKKLPHKVRYYDGKEAAEMIAIHNA
jgi:hypothetical protein